MALSMDNPAERYRLAQRLDEINGLEDGAGRPLLSAVVVQKGTHRPGSGFFEVARQLGKTMDDEDEYYVTELQAVFDYWRGTRKG